MYIKYTIINNVIHKYNIKINHSVFKILKLCIYYELRQYG